MAGSQPPVTSQDSGPPSPPTEVVPTSPPHPPELLQLWDDVRNTLYALPAYFNSPLRLQGIAATDLFTFAASLGATIEEQVVENLNRLRNTTWDQQKRFAHYAFERQPQRFPDVILTTNAPNLTPKTLLGIELKGWYVLAKEGEPTFRYTVTPAVAAELDLLAVFPWALTSVVSGSPFLYPPYVVGARYAAEYRNWHWQHGMRSSGNKAIKLSQATGHFPLKSDPISDVPVQDAGKNFGRLARTTLMDQFTQDVGRLLLSGIPVSAWRRFFRVFTENPNPAAIDNLIRQLERERRSDPHAIFTSTEQIARFRQLLEDMAALFAQK